ncbi:hypothetical protein [Algibacter lectus]|uniref:Lipoprotein n=1 Tax=Algibacter lectus TaxID=221126 RepID=A0A090X140_9FLAO|nr:hypothetical protein [Algibacter lectus]MWW26669.1 hypothetical protein [Algibacter lectus]TDY65406.1 hypothetical protein DFQ06_0004 [Algibacter lectus]GAL81554.1 hypothetical protein JCM19274_399 [Algibacter lectus]
MNKILTFILIFLTFSCIDNKKEKEIQPEEVVKSKPIKTEKNIFDFVFRDIKEIEYFSNFEVGTSSVINFEKSKWEYAISEMQNKQKRIIILEKIVETGKPEKKFQILDTIHINNFKTNEFMSFGVCQNNEKADSRIFTVIESSENDFDLEIYTNIKKAWKANLETKKIEEISDISGVNCMNESYGI